MMLKKINLILFVLLLFSFSSLALVDYPYEPRACNQNLDCWYVTNTICVTDSDCNGQEICSDKVCTNFDVVCSGGLCYTNTETNCFDNIDADLDGLVDCADPDCEKVISSSNDQFCFQGNINNLLSSTILSSTPTNIDCIDLGCNTNHCYIGNNKNLGTNVANYGLYCLSDLTYDYNKDGCVNNNDIITINNNLNSFILTFSTPTTNNIDYNNLNKYIWGLFDNYDGNCIAKLQSLDLINSPDLSVVLNPSTISSPGLNPTLPTIKGIN